MNRRYLVYLLSFLIFFHNIQPVFSAGDTTPPKLTSASINKKSFMVGETVSLSFFIEEKESGLSQVAGDHAIELRHESGKRYITHLHYDSPNKVSLNLKLSSSMLKGNWSVASISVKDKAGNSIYYHSNDIKLSNLYFNLINGLEDFNAPTVKSIYVLNKAYQPGNVVKVEITAQEQSGLEGIYGLVQFKHSLTDSYISDYLVYNKSTKKHEVKLTLPKTIKNGTWEFFYISMQDIHGNSATYTQYTDSYFKNHKFTVTGGSNDFTPPVLKSVNLSKSTLYNGEEFRVEVDAYDVSGISKAQISFKNKLTGRTFWSNLEWDGYYKKYIADFEIPLDSPIGEWEVSQVYLSDTATNPIFYLPETHPKLLPKINVLPLFRGTDNLIIKNGTNFNPLIGVQAMSPFEGDITDKISIFGEVDTKLNGIYLLKYTVPSKKNNYIYEDYRWITVDDGMQVDIINNESTLFFDSNVQIGLPENNINLTLQHGSKSSRISSDQKLTYDGEYKLALNSGASAMNTSSTKPLKVKKTLKFVIDKTPPTPPVVNKITKNTTVIKGKTDKRATVYIGIYGRKGITVKANVNGYYSAKIPKLKTGTKIKFSVKDRFNRPSKPVTKVVTNN